MHHLLEYFVSFASRVQDVFILKRSWVCFLLAFVLLAYYWYAMVVSARTLETTANHIITQTWPVQLPLLDQMSTWTNQHRGIRPTWRFVELIVLSERLHPFTLPNAIARMVVLPGISTQIPLFRRTKETLIYHRSILVHHKKVSGFDSFGFVNQNWIIRVPNRNFI